MCSSMDRGGRMPTDGSGTGGSAHPDHSARDKAVANVVGLAFGIYVAHTDPSLAITAPVLSTDGSPTISQVEPAPQHQPERLPVTEEEVEGAHVLDEQREKRQREFDLDHVVRVPEQVEDRRRDTRPER